MRYILTALILPPAMNFILLLIALILWRNNRKLAMVFGSVSLLALLALSIPAVKCFLFKGLEPYPALDAASLQQPGRNPGAIVVLGGGIYVQQPEYGASVPSDLTNRRLLYAVYLHEQTGLPLLLSGGAPGAAERSEAEAMAEILRRFAIEPGWVESNSRNTWENALFSVEYLQRSGIDQVLLVSDAWHLPRAVYSFEQQGMDVIPAPTGFESRCGCSLYYWIPGSWSFFLSSFAIREYLGLLAYHWGQAEP